MARRRQASGTPPEDVVARSLNETLPGRQEHEQRILRYDKAYQIWRGTPAARIASHQRAWDARMRIKYGMQVVDQTMVNVVQGAPKAVCSPRTPHSVGAAKAMEQILGYFSDLDHLAESEPVIVQQALVYGVSPAKNVWRYTEKDVVRGWNPQGGRDGTGSWEPGTVRIVQDDRPSLIPWDVYDCWWEPLAPNPDAAQYVVLREWPTKDELLARAYNPDSKVGMLRNLDLLFATGTNNVPTPTAQNQVMGDAAAAALRQGRFHIEEIWRDGRLTIIGNRQILLYDGPKPYWMPGKPVVVGNSRPDFLRIEGISETELVDDIQQALWTHENLVMENLKMTVMRGATVRETVPDMNQLVLRPNYLWPVTDHDDVHFQDPPPLAPEAFNQRSTLLGAMQYVTGISQFASSGVGLNQGVDPTTATGASITSSGASKILEFKARLIALRVYQRSYEQWVELTKQFLSQPMAVKIGADEWAEYGPGDVYGDYDVRVQAGEESLNRQQKRAEAVAVANALGPYVQAFPGLMKPIVEQIGQAYGWLDIDRVLDQVQQQGQAPAASPVAQAPTQLTQGGGIVPQPQQAILAGNAR